MLAIILEEDPHTRNVLRSMLSAVGFTQVLEAQNTEEFDFICDQNPNKIRLIVSAFRHEEGLDLPLSRMIIQKRDLDWVPLLILTNRGLNFTLNFTRSRFSRIDSYLDRPFGTPSLTRSIAAAHKRRSEMRNVVLVIGKEEDANIIEATYDSEEENHWKTVIFAKNLADLKAKQTEYGFRVGTILIDPAYADEPLGKYITQLKKNASTTTVVGILSDSPESTFHFRASADFFFSDTRDWDHILFQCSRYLLNDWEARQVAQVIKTELKAKHLKKLATIFGNLDRAILSRPEIKELKGLYSLQVQNTEEAIRCFKRGIAANPCQPSLYLQLAAILEGEEKKALLEKAVLYCPKHPQIKKLHEETLT